MKKYVAMLGMSLLLTACTTTHDETTSGEETANDEEHVEAEADTEEETEQATETDIDTEGEGGFLWKIEEGETTVYLQGTIHAGIEEIYPLNEELEVAFDEADVLLPEIDWPRMDPTGGLSEEEMMDLMTFDDDRVLSDVLDGETYEALLDVMASEGMPEDMLEQIEPWYFVMGLEDVEAGEITLDQGVDYHYLERGYEEGKEIRELEGQIISLQAMEEQSYELQVEQLEDVLNQDHDVEDEIGEVDFFNMYMHGDEEAMFGVWEDGSYGDEYDRTNLFDRNERNANIIDEILQEDDGQTYLALIGTFHYIIEPGVQHFLEEKGYTVERIN
ncbi:hypothetical protein DH09_18940 [Bacillaceae bacterium JMAK1]|nr:hypothetical protein DH09_18940 [Bacillaceae bacterium JMAK1]